MFHLVISNALFMAKATMNDEKAAKQYTLNQYPEYYSGGDMNDDMQRKMDELMTAHEAGQEHERRRIWTEIGRAWDGCSAGILKRIIFGEGGE